MQKSKIILRTLFFMLLSIVMINTHAQTGLNFQGVARTTNNVILASQSITIKLSILQGSATGTADYTETRRVTTNAQGLFTAVIGDTGAINTLGNFTTINWKLSPKFLKIEMDAAAGTNFITMGTTQFQYVAYAQFAKSVDAENIVGIVPVTLGGTGVSTIAGLKTALTLNNVNNTTDLAKPISTLTQTALDLKLNAADTSKYTKQTYSDSALLTKLSITGNAATATTATTATTAGTASTATKLATARSINGVGFDGSGDITVTADAGTLTGTTLKSTVTGSSLTSVGTLANLTVTNAIAGSITGNAATATTATTATTAGTASTATKLATARSINGVGFDGSGDITVTADAGTLTGTTLKSTVTGSSLTSVGTLANLTVTNAIAGSITGNAATATTATTATTAGTASTATKLATARSINGVGFDGSGDITVTADAGTLTGTTLKSTVTGSSLTSVGTLANLTVTNAIAGSITGNAATATTAGNITSTTNTTLTSLSNLATVGTITSGVWSGTAVAVEKGGTGLTSAGTNGQILTSTNAGTLTWTTPVFLPTVVIGTQQWMEKNLDVLTYRNGDVIPQVTDPTAWARLTTGAWCWYSNSADNGAIYGKLYNWYAVNDPRGLAPQGWHIPTDAEWTTLGTLLGGDAAAGGKMKTTGTTRWTTPNASATNESGYAGLPGGFRYYDGAFYAVGNAGYWWSATENNSTAAWGRDLYYLDGYLFRNSFSKENGFSVRCLRD
jgi:uncharacterized protein (TIGR02145 family)